ncbi:MAG: DsbA family protein [Methanobrevibacter sp.]|nr:DsbA family protein [Methanobrevibacter sp.]
MKIVHWSDFNCPNSYIGLNRLKQALDELELNVEWEMKPFELHPTLFDTPANSMTTEYVIKYGIGPDEANEIIRETEDIAKSEGLDINYKDVRLTSSRNAHRLVRYVQNKHPEKSLELIFKIFEANFIANETIADIDVLVSVATGIGLDENEVRNLLEGESYMFEVQLEEEESIIMGIEAIPFYMITINDEQLTVPGAFEKEDFKIAIRDMISGEMESKTFL